MHRQRGQNQRVALGRTSCARAVLWLLTAAFALASRPQVLRAQDTVCESENECSFKKPNILLVLDFSSSMSGSVNAPAYFPPGQTATTRWTAELDAADWILRYDRGFFADNTRIGLSRFGHDPDTKHPGTTVVTDHSFPRITDGFAVDVPFDGSDGQYFQCKGSAIDAATMVLRGTPPPPVDGLDINSLMLTWTRGALRSAHQLITRTRDQHRGEPGEDKRDYEVVLMTDGDWTCPDSVGQGCDENPAPEAALLRADGVPVHVIAFGDATMVPSLNEVALQGGTGQSIDAMSPQGIVDAFSGVLDGIRGSVIVPTCTQKLPRMLIIMDGSSSMLEGTAPGETKWDKARFALAGNPAAPNPSDPGYVEAVLAHKLMLNGRAVAIEDVLHLGMVSFGAANEQHLIADFGPCMRDNFAWAMDPATSCKAPGCSDPYGGGPITWTFQDSDTDRSPRFVRTTHSFMPDCTAAAGSGSCGSAVPTTFTGQGLRFAQQVIHDYERDSSPFPIDDQTRFVNVLITDGQTSSGSSDVQAALASLVSEGIDTYVIGFGSGTELDPAELDQYAQWGNTAHAIIVDPTIDNSVGALADALSGVVSSLGLDACCVLNDCEVDPEPADPGPVCGDGKIEGGEVCDDGPLNVTYGHCGGDCRGLHLYCGDGRIDGPEQCDDGNHKDDDGCDRHCRLDTDLDAGITPDEDAGGVRSRVNTLPIGSAPPRPIMSAPMPAAVGATPVTPAPIKAAAHANGCGCSAIGVSEPGRLYPLLIGALMLRLVRARRRRR
jgi:cysteine-rich repeat protein